MITIPMTTAWYNLLTQNVACQCALVSLLVDIYSQTTTSARAVPQKCSAQPPLDIKYHSNRLFTTILTYHQFLTIHFVQALMSEY